MPPGIMAPRRRGSSVTLPGDIMTEDSPSPEERIIPLLDPKRDNPSLIALMLARAAAIQAYANVEQSLASVFSTLLQTDSIIAGIIFFRIVNARSRLTIMEEIIQYRYASTYNVFCKSGTKLLHSIDSTSNNIIHCHVVQNFNNRPEGPLVTFTLNRPDVWAKSTSSAISESDLAPFTQKCDFISSLLGCFCLVLLNRLPAENAKPWL